MRSFSLITTPPRSGWRQIVTNIIIINDISSVHPCLHLFLRVGWVRDHFLFVCDDVQYIVMCACLIVVVFCTLCYQILWIVHFWLPFGIPKLWLFFFSSCGFLNGVFLGSFLYFVFAWIFDWQALPYKVAPCLLLATDGNQILSGIGVAVVNSTLRKSL